MALPFPNLDDKTFDTLVEEATALIPSQAPAWTDHNQHDPGITFIELFAWLAEMQQFYLNRIRDENYLKYLKLLGVTPQQGTSARADITFAFNESATAIDLVPPGTRLTTGDLVFETETALYVVPVRLVQVLSSSRAGLQDQTEANRLDGLTFAAFGEEAEVRSRLYLGFDVAFPATLPIALTFNLFEAYPVARGQHADEAVETVASARITWEYFNTAASWVPLDVQHDETLMLSQSGRLGFTAPSDMQRRLIQPFTNELFWLRATVRQAGYELPPRIDTVVLNTVAAREQETLSEVTTFSGSGEASQVYEASSYLAFNGDTQVQVREADGRWRDWQERADFATSGADDLHYTLGRSEAEKKVLITFGDGVNGKIPPEGENNIRLIVSPPGSAAQRLLGRSNGLPKQIFTLGRTPVIGASLVLQVEEQVTTAQGKEKRWRDWCRVQDFDASRPGDPHYTLQPETGEIRFGDGLNGDVPAVPEDPESHNIRVIAYQVGGGVRGNVPAEAITEIVQPVPESLWLASLTGRNRRAAAGGTDAENLAAAQTRARHALQQPTRAVTSDDFEFLARATPGLRVARAKAVPLFAPGVRGYPETQVPATVTVVVVPYSLSPRPTPSSGFLQTVCHHLDRHRLITTKLHVVGPGYVRINVQAEVLLQPGFQPANARGRIEKALHTFLHPLDGGPDGTGWPFGRSVYRSEIYQQIEQVEGVDCVQSLALAATGGGGRRSPEGNIVIPPHSLVYAGEHRLETLRPEVVCRARGVSP